MVRLSSLNLLIIRHTLACLFHSAHLDGVASFPTWSVDYEIDRNPFGRVSCVFEGFWLAHERIGFRDVGSRESFSKNVDDHCLLILLGFKIVAYASLLMGS